MATTTQTAKRTLKQYVEWIVPAIALVVVAVYFKTEIAAYLATIVGTAPKMVMLSLVFGLAILTGMTVAIWLIKEKISFANILKRLSIMVVLFAMAWGVNAYATIFPI